MRHHGNAVCGCAAQGIEQVVTALPFLPDQVPALFIGDRSPYIPVVALCQALGIPAQPHMRRWRTLLLWYTARKLPYQTDRGTRLVWCLPQMEVPFLYGLFPWNLVSSERQIQLQQACEQQTQLLSRAFFRMHDRYKQMRRELFTFLAVTEGIEASLLAHEALWVVDLPAKEHNVLAELIGRGCFLYEQTRAHIRTMLQDQQDMPLLDVYTFSEQQESIPVTSLPLFPIFAAEETLKQWIESLAIWHEEWRHWECQERRFSN